MDREEKQRLVEDDLSSLGSQKVGFLNKLLPEGSLNAGVFNIASATLGAGALTLPYALRKSGLIFGVFWLALGMLTTIYSIKLLIDVIEAVRFSPAWKGPRNLDSYEGLSLHLFGPKMEHFVEAQIIIFCYGTAIAYVVAVGDILDPVRKLDFMPEAFKDHYGRQLVMVLFWALLMLPLSFLKNVNSLRFSSLLGVCSILILVAATIYHCSINRLTDWDYDCKTPHDASGSGCADDIEYFVLDGTTALTIPLIMLAYTCQVNVFSIYQELNDATPKKMMKISWLGMGGICFVVYALMGVFGYLDFLGDTQGNILKNSDFDPSSNVFIAIAFVAIALTVVVAFPLVVFPCRDSIFSIILQPKIEEREDAVQQARINPDLYDVASASSSHVYMPGPGAAGGQPRIYKKPPNWMHYSVSFSISFSALIIALVIPNIQVVFQFLGGLCSSVLCFVLPAAFMKKMMALETEHFAGTDSENVTATAEYPDLWTEPGLPTGFWSKLCIECLFWGGILAGIGSTVVSAISL